MTKKTIAIDFDGVIHKYSKGWMNGEIYDTPIDGAVEAWYSLYNAGYELVVLTSRDNLDDVREWMHKYFDFERRIGHFYEPLITNLKVQAIAYIDDRGIRFTNWSDIRKIYC
jgi:5'(3')-deoxyribonucleotidase